MKYKSVFDIIGPVMIGPSSSHTAGAARIGKMARELFGRDPEWANISFYGSFAKTYKGHGTDVAIIGGIMDFETDDERIIEAKRIAREKGIRIKIREEEALTDHPNTARIKLGDKNGEMELVGISIGGGKIEIIELNGFELSLTGHHPAILVVHEDRFGAVAAVSTVLARHKMNIGKMDVSRQDVGKMALMTIEVDQHIEDALLEELKALPEVTQVTKIAD
ncbi:L-serine ammonia-lyase, iron-sulfur-dependent subunit beta [Jeotgalibacillus haloalkalitolerans]|uniref:L-serine deaminase n=1 Tax=Jeotgalibacillus haloalkalitolerans TaxID=3104292 RepID=A0ABU5KKB1_9BACL|nr:L-serine ammonia-lyase, iron-sulfur-dependent subunit beta [Jeotgalibacillus sp. HH7-29]MDZ5711681.1 L-serine ammonia-lyase, iron-sulfur-dependent subunit beta [Jeotgalibacillus sp. HH7-29]